jgi:acyl carrier protein
MTEEVQFLNTATEIFRAELDLPDLKLGIDSSQTTIPAWDSLAHVRIITGIERAFGIQLAVDEIEQIHSVRDLFNALLRHGKLSGYRSP